MPEDCCHGWLAEHSFTLLTDEGPKLVVAKDAATRTAWLTGCPRIIAAHGGGAQRQPSAAAEEPPPDGGPPGEMVRPPSEQRCGATTDAALVCT
eukprot:COSAG01_NODE_5968_length_3926_cov_209.840345_3_plen_94_part_00